MYVCMCVCVCVCVCEVEVVVSAFLQYEIQSIMPYEYSSYMIHIISIDLSMIYDVYEIYELENSYT